MKKAFILSLPRPSAINESIMRKADVKLNELQEAEELIKREMLTMLHHDALQYPSANHKDRNQKPNVESQWFVSCAYALDR